MKKILFLCLIISFNSIAQAQSQVYVKNAAEDLYCVPHTILEGELALLIIDDLLINHNYTIKFTPHIVAAMMYSFLANDSRYIIPIQAYSIEKDRQIVKITLFNETGYLDELYIVIYKAIGSIDFPIGFDNLFAAFLLGILLGSILPMGLMILLYLNLLRKTRQNPNSD